MGKLTQRTHELEKYKTAWMKIQKVRHLKRHEDPFVEPCQENDSESESSRSSRQRSTSTPRGDHREVRGEDSTPAIPPLNAASLWVPAAEVHHSSDGGSRTNCYKFRNWTSFTVRTGCDVLLRIAEGSSIEPSSLQRLEVSDPGRCRRTTNSLCVYYEGYVEIMQGRLTMKNRRRWQ